MTQRPSEMSSFPAPEGRRSVARGASPWDKHGPNALTSPGGAVVAQVLWLTEVRLPPLRGSGEGGSDGDQGLAPLATDRRPSGAKKQTSRIASQLQAWAR